MIFFILTGLAQTGSLRGHHPKIWWCQSPTKNWLVPVSSSKAKKNQEDPSLGDDPSRTRMGFLFSGEALTGLGAGGGKVRLLPGYIFSQERHSPG